MRIFLIAITFLLSCIPILSEGFRYSFPLEAINLVIAFICSYQFYQSDERPFSLHKIFHLFFLFFFCIAPMIQFKNNTDFLKTTFKEEEYILTSSYVLGILVLYNIIYLLISTKKNTSTPQTNENKGQRSSPIGTTGEITLIVLASSIFLYFLHYNGYNIYALFFRGGEFIGNNEESGIFDLFLNNFLRPMTMILFLGASIRGVRHKPTLFLLGTFFILTAMPTSMARFATAAMYIPVLLWFIPALRRKNVFVLTIMTGLLVVFPFLNTFREYSSQTEVEFSLNFEQFEELHFDAYSMFMRVLTGDYVTYGRQLLGVILFWVPRSFWPAKPIGSGAFIAEQQGLWFSNISMPYFGEGYINFGTIGVILFVFFLAFATAKIDDRYWNYEIYQNDKFRQIFYFLLLGLLMFILRGDLLSSFAFTCGFLCSYFFVKYIAFKTA